MSDRYDTVESAINYANNAYDRSGKYLVDGVVKYAAHAVRMEETTGLTGIAGRYKFVDGKEASFAEYDYRKAYQKYSIADGFLKSDNPILIKAGEHFKDEMPKALTDMNNEIKKLTELNPEIAKLNYNKNDIIETYRAIIGLTSQYNVDDVNAYLHNVRTGTKNKDTIQRVEALTKNKNIRFGWQPASKTLDKIEEQLKQRENALIKNQIQSKSR